MSLVFPDGSYTTTLPAPRPTLPATPARKPGDPYGDHIRKILGTKMPGMPGEWVRQPDGSYSPASNPGPTTDSPPRPTRPADAVARPFSASPAYDGVMTRPPLPFLPGNVPNPEYGKFLGLEWDGQRWVKANPNADLERQLMELELERRRKDMEEDGGPQGDVLKSWLARKLGG